MKSVAIYTDGACSGNPGPGGWGALIIHDNSVDELCGGEKYTTNNRMELQAVIHALERLPEACSIELYTDSSYVKGGITKWIYTWEKNGWRNSQREPVKNVDLWLRLQELSGKHKISWNWVRGHSGNELNNRVDKLARSQCR
ncbi:MAG: ribonuclease HI [Holosporaceae bacterium]|nr:ribonuclease HI [Holosporaceae bacterium]